MTREGHARNISRRHALKVGGTALGGLALGTTTVTGRSTRRFLMKPDSAADFRKLGVEERLGALDYVAVSGPEREVDRQSVAYAPDPLLDVEAPAATGRTPQSVAEVRDEPLAALQWDKQDLQVPTAQNVTRGEGVRVAVIDTGIAAGHPDLVNVNLALSANFTDDGLGVGRPYGGYHGTHVAGIIAASDENDAGVVGTAPGAELVDCRVVSYGEGVPFSVVLAALLHSVEIESDIANLSLGAYNPRQEFVRDGQFGQFYGRLLNHALTHAHSEGTVVVMAAGNSGADLQHDKQWIVLPAEGAQGLSVSATGPVGFHWGDEGLEAGFETPAFYTNYGTDAIDLGAPGGNAAPAAIGTDVPWYYDFVLSTVATFDRNDAGEPTGDVSYSYNWAAGTSMAAPNVSGAAALVKANNPEYSPAQVEAALKRAAEVPDGHEKTYYGAGYLNLLAAL